MKLGWLTSAVLLAATTALCAQALAPLPRGIRIAAELRTKLDSSKAHVGDVVTAVTTAALKAHGVTLLPKGATLDGAVTEVVAAESKKSPAELGIAFTQATTKQGQTLPLHAAIAAVQVLSPLDAMPGMERPGADTADQSAAAAATQQNNTSMGGDHDRTMTLGSQDVPAQVTGTNNQIDAMARAAQSGGIEIHPAGKLGSILKTGHGDLKLDRGAHVVVVVE